MNDMDKVIRLLNHTHINWTVHIHHHDDITTKELTVPFIQNGKTKHNPRNVIFSFDEKNSLLNIQGEG